MRYKTGALRRAMGQPARAWRSMQPGRRAVGWMEREPVAGCAGAAFLLVAAPGLAVLLLVRLPVPEQAFLAREAESIVLLGLLLISAARLARWRR